MKVFLSSTCYDLPDLRASLERYLLSMGHEALLSNRTTFPVNLSLHRHDVCLSVVSRAELFIMVIDKRTGAPYYKDDSISITRAEYRQALKVGKDILAFIRNDVQNERQTYLKNKCLVGFKPFFVDSIAIFEFISEIQSNGKGFWIQPFSNVTEIVDLLDSIFKSRSNKLLDSQSEQKMNVSSVHLIALKGRKHIRVSEFSEPTRAFMKKVHKENEFLSKEELSEIIGLIPYRGNTLGTLIDFEISSYGIPGYTEAITIKPMDDDGSSWLCEEMPTALGLSVLKELVKASQLFED